MNEPPSSLERSAKLSKPQGNVTDWALRSSFISFILDAIQSFLNLKVLVQQTDGSNVLPPVWAKVTQTKDGTTIILPPIAANGEIGGGQVFGGVGPPSASTLLAGNYASGDTPDAYVDKNANVWYYCSTAGTNQVGQPGGSAWTQINGGTASIAWAVYNNAVSYNPGSIVRVATVQTIGTVTLTPGDYICIVFVPANGTLNQIPQYPEPTSGIIYWRNIRLGPQQFGLCVGGNSQQIWVDASAPFS